MIPSDNHYTMLHLLIFFTTQSCRGISDRNINLGSTLYNGFPLQCRNIMSNLSTEFPVMHHEQIKLRRGVNQELLKTRGKDMSGLLVGAIANVWHKHTSFELPPHPRIDTLGPAPAWLDTDLAVALWADKLFDALLHDLRFNERSDHGGCFSLFILLRWEDNGAGEEKKT